MKKILTALMVPLILLPAMALAADPNVEAAVEIPDPFHHPSAVISEPSLRRPVPASWKWSLVPLVASQTLDIASSYGMRELNPLLAGPQQQFSVKATVVKVAVTAAFLGAEYLIVKVHPRAAKMLTTINWSGAALTSGFAIHNFSIR